jgi:hypothetical protein
MLCRCGCGRELPPSQGTVARVWFSEACRKRAARRARTNGDGWVLPPSGALGAVEVAVRTALVSEEALTGVDGAYAALAVRTAQMVDGGSVPAVAQLRAVLAELAARVDDDTAAFLRLIQTPGIHPNARQGGS